MAGRAPPTPPGPGESEADRAYRGAITGADAYRATRGAVRVTDGVVRLGNRFVRLDRYREIAFLAVGRAALSMGFALVDALGDALTQGYLAGPDAVPEAIPFQHRRVADSAIGGPEAEAVAAAAIEMAAGLGERDLFIVGLSPGALGLLAAPPPGVEAGTLRSAVAGLRAAGATAADVERFVRASAAGAVGGRLAAAGPAELLPLAVDRGVGGALVGGGPTLPLAEEERTEARNLLARLAPTARLPPEAARLLTGPLPARPTRPVPRVVVVAGPADAVQGAGDALSEVRWWSRLAGLDLAGGPETVAAGFPERFEEVLRGVPKSRESRKGIAVFAAGPLDCPDGEGEAAALARLLPALRSGARHRDQRFVVFRTAGARPGEAGLSAGIADATGGAVRPIPAASEGRPGVTDVGPVILALRPERSGT